MPHLDTLVMSHDEPRPLTRTLSCWSHAFGSLFAGVEVMSLRFFHGFLADLELLTTLVFPPALKSLSIHLSGDRLHERGAERFFVATAAITALTVRCPPILAELNVSPTDLAPIVARLHPTLSVGLFRRPDDYRNEPTLRCEEGRWE